MKLFHGEIVDVFRETKIPMARVRTRGALTNVALGLTPDARPGDQVLVCDGVVLNKVLEPEAAMKGES